MYKWKRTGLGQPVLFLCFKMYAFELRVMLKMVFESTKYIHRGAVIERGIKIIYYDQKNKKL